MRLQDCQQAYAKVVQKLTSELPQLLDKQWYGVNDALPDEMMKLKASLGFELFDPTHGYLTAVAKLPEKSGFRQAVKDHILSRLRDDAKDGLLYSIRDLNLANKRDEINFKKLNMGTTAKYLETCDELKSQISAENWSANRDAERERILHNSALRSSVNQDRLRLQALGYTMKLEPNYDINLLHNVVDEHKSHAWYIGRYSEKAQTCDYRYQMRLHSFIACLNASSDTVKRTNNLALIEKGISTEPDDIFTDEKFWQTGKK